MSLWIHRKNQVYRILDFSVEAIVVLIMGSLAALAPALLWIVELVA